MSIQSEVAHLQGLQKFFLQITRSEKVSVKDTMDKPDGMKTIKKPDLMKEKSRNASAIEKPEPIQLPPSFNKVPMVKQKSHNATNLSLSLSLFLSHSAFQIKLCL